MARASREGRRLVLLVEDDADTYELYSEILATSGFDVIGADNGEDAIRKAVENQPDVVVMDYELRGVDGTTATAQLKQDPRTRRIPVMMLTGHVARRHVERAHAAGCDVVVSKPCSLQNLVDQVQSLIRDKQSPAAPRILVVEDDTTVCVVTQRVLSQAGFDVRCASNGRVALESLRNGEPLPSLILLDLNMPEMNGWAFRAEQACDPALSGIPVVVLSGASVTETATQSLAAREYVRKPFESTALLSVVERHVHLVR